MLRYLLQRGLGASHVENKLMGISTCVDRFDRQSLCCDNAGDNRRVAWFPPSRFLETDKVIAYRSKGILNGAIVETITKHSFNKVQLIAAPPHTATGLDEKSWSVTSTTAGYC